MHDCVDTTQLESPPMCDLHHILPFVWKKPPNLASSNEHEVQNVGEIADTVGQDLDDGCGGGIAWWLAMWSVWLNGMYVCVLVSLKVWFHLHCS